MPDPLDLDELERLVARWRALRCRAEGRYELTREGLDSCGERQRDYMLFLAGEAEPLLAAFHALLALARRLEAAERVVAAAREVPNASIALREALARLDAQGEEETHG